MRILDRLQVIERKLKDFFSFPNSFSEPMKMRQMILDEIEDKIVSMGRGNCVFPFNRITVRFFVENDEQRQRLTTFFMEGDSLKDQIISRLRRAGCPVPPGLSVLAEMDSRTMENEKAFVLDCQKTKRVTPSKARLLFLTGAAGESAFTITKTVYNIGRSEEVTDKNKQRVIRRNDMVFPEGGESTHTVSRIHAHIEVDADSAEYLIFDDNSERGTRIFRDGKTIPVVSASGRGVRLKSGDEISFGQVRVRFEVED